MNLKNAAACCLISFFSATLVMLIARTLDSQAAARVEPQLMRIVEELAAIRKQGGSPANTAHSTASDEIADGLVVYYFHGASRCQTCRAIESQAHETVQRDFAAQLHSGEIVWKKLNYEDAVNSELARKFEIQVPVVVLARVNDGQVEDWRRLDEVWALVDDEPAFAEFIRDEMSRMLSVSTLETDPAQRADASEIAAPSKQTDDVPLSTDATDLPIP